MHLVRPLACLAVSLLSFLSDRRLCCVGPCVLCCRELYTLFALFENEQDSLARLLVVDITTGGPDIATRLQRFDVKNAHCYGPNGEYKIRQAIEAGPGGAEAFSRIMRRLGDRLAHEKELADQDASEDMLGRNKRASTQFLSPLELDEEDEQGGTPNPVYDDRRSSMVAEI